MSKKKYDFSGYATKNDLKCSDGRVILQDAFKHQDGKTVPLVWQHFHNDPSNILGHATLENRKDGVYCYGSFNDSENGQNAKEAVDHGDISFLSIYANQLKEQAKKVAHGNIKEVSLVLSGANPGAVIDNVVIQHADGTYSDAVEDEALIYTGLEIVHGDVEAASEGNADGEKKTVTEIFDTLTDEQKAAVNTVIAHANKTADGTEGTIEHAQNDPTIKEVFDTFTESQQKVVYYMIGSALKAKAADTGEVKHSNLKEGEKVMKHNVFDQGTENTKKNTFTPEQLQSIVDDAPKYGGSLKKSFLAHAEEYGFDPIDILFPDARDTHPGGPVTIQRNTTWVGKVLGKTKHTPFARIRTRIADLTADEARAKGYVTGNLKKEQVVTLLKRSTTPTTIYKKQKLDRDDMIDITDFDVVVWLKNEMRGMLDEEIARAVLISDGRSAADEDKINEQNVRPIATDDPNVFVVRVQVEANETTDDIIDEFIRARKDYKGSGTPDLYISTDLLTEMLLLKDQFGHRLYKTVQELASVLRVGEIIEVEPMNNAVRVSGDDEFAILGIVVNLSDYTIGADKGGQIAMFDDFDIDYNQYKYLIETRISGALTLPKSAIVVERKPA